MEQCSPHDVMVGCTGLSDDFPSNKESANSYHSTQIIQVRELPNRCWWPVRYDLQLAGQYFDEETKQGEDANRGGMFSRRVNLRGIGTLRVTMNDGHVVIGVGCLFGWNTVLTYAGLLQQGDRNAVSVEFAAKTIHDTTIWIKGERWKVPKGYSTKLTGIEIAVVVLKNQNASSICGRSTLQIATTEDPESLVTLFPTTQDKKYDPFPNNEFGWWDGYDHLRQEKYENYGSPTILRGHVQPVVGVYVGGEKPISFLTAEALNWLSQATFSENKIIEVNHNSRLPKRALSSLLKASTVKQLYISSIACNLGQQSISVEGLKLLAQGEWPNLEALVIYDGMIGDEGVHILIHAQWPNLTHINLDGNMITKQGLIFLTRSNWPCLRQLLLVSNFKARQYGWTQLMVLLRTAWPAIRTQGLYCKCREWPDDQQQDLVPNRQQLQALLSRTKIEFAPLNESIMQPDFVD